MTVLIFPVLFISSCDDINNVPGTSLVSDNSAPIILLLKHRNDDYSEELSGHVLNTLRYTKIPTKTLDLGLISSGLNIDNSIKTIVVTTFRVSELSDEDVASLVRFVSSGGNLVFVGPVSYDNFAYLQGIKPFPEYTFDEQGKGVYLFEEAFPGMKGKEFFYPDAQLHKGLKRNQFRDDVIILAGSANVDDAPFMILNKIGLGEVVTINSYAINNKDFRGFIYSAVLRGLEGIPYSVAQVNTLFLDDFPAPLYPEKLKPIDAEYDATHAEFVSNIWWPDMKALADSMKLKYTAMTAFNYNANILPPFDFNEWNAGKITVNNERLDGSPYLARNVFETGHELGFHGYNHFSLWKEDWNSEEFMISSLQAARKQWRVDKLGPMPKIYVPPTNIIDSTGIAALTKSMPSIRYMSSIYLGIYLDGGAREFGPEPFAPTQLFNYPRISSGFSMEDNSIFDQQGLQLVTGIWTHFIHPDDVFQILQRDSDTYRSRNPLGLGWKTDETYKFGLYHLLKRRIEFTIQHYPLSDFLTASEGAQFAKDWINKSLHLEINKDSVFVRQYFPSRYQQVSDKSENHYFMYVKEQDADTIESYFSKSDIQYDKSTIWEGFLYQFQTASESLKIPNIRNENINEDFLVSTIDRSVKEFERYFSTEYWEEVPFEDTRLEDAMAAYDLYPDSVQIQDSLIVLAVEFNKIDTALTILEKRLYKNKPWSDEDIDNLIRFYGWESDTERAKMYLDSLWSRYPGKESLEIEHKANQELGLSERSHRIKWAERDMEINPNELQPLFDYLQYTDGENNWDSNRKLLIDYLQKMNYPDTLVSYIFQRSLFYDGSEEKLDLLQQIPQNKYDALSPYALEIAYFYAYEMSNYSRALFWAEKSDQIPDRNRLEWLAELNLYNRFIEISEQSLAKNPQDDSLRSYIGLTLFYEGFRDRGYQVLYPLFENGKSEIEDVNTLIRSEIRYMSFIDKKEFYRMYPDFFADSEINELKRQERTLFGIAGYIKSEYRTDNFNNDYFSVIAGAEWGRRGEKLHQIGTQVDIIGDQADSQINSRRYYGLTYKFTRTLNEPYRQYYIEPSFLSSGNKFLGTLITGYSVSTGQTFSSYSLGLSPAPTNAAIDRNYYRVQLQTYREESDFIPGFSTGISATARYYTNEVFEAEGIIRLFYTAYDQNFRLRPVTDISYADATTSYLSGFPYFTPDKYFSKGIGLEGQFRVPDNFEYNTLVLGEIMAKHERQDGYFLRATLNLEHQLNSFWDIRIGSELSSSRVYRYNRLFFTVSHTFN